MTPLSGVMVGDRESLESLISRAKSSEKEYDWRGAATLYRSALSSISEADTTRAGYVLEMLSHALFKSAFQADRTDEFRSQLEDSITVAARALESYRGATQSSASLLARRCEGMIAFSNFWLVSDPQEKRKLVVDAWNLCDDALNGFEKIQNHEEHGVTLEYLALSAALTYSYEDDPRNRESILRNAVDHGEKAVQCSDTLENPGLAAAVCAICAAFVKALGAGYTSVHSRDPVIERAKDYWARALSICRQQAILELSYCDILWGLPLNPEECESTLQSTLVECRKTRDKLLIGSVLEMLVGALQNRASGTEDEETRKNLFDDSLQLAREAKDLFSVISYLTPSYKVENWAEVPEAGYYALLVWATADLKKKREYAEKGLPYAREEVRRAIASGFPDLVFMCKDTLDHIILLGLAETETDPEQKARLLEESIELRTEVLRSSEKYYPLRPDYTGWSHGPLGHAKLELATLAKDRVLKEELLKDCVRHEETAIESAKEYRQPWMESDSFSVEIDAYCWHKLVCGLHGLFELTGQASYLEKAIESLDTMARMYQKASMFGRMAECHWRIALYQDILGRFQTAAENFRGAADDFRSAAQKLPSLKVLYDDHSLYMSAWEGIEEAKYHHSRQKYAKAKESYERAAALHESTEKWAFLASNYLALAKVEDAEDLSQKEQSKESIDAFKEASRLFRDSEARMHEGLTKIEGPDEKQMVETLIGAVDYRQSFCSARITLEEARALDKDGLMGDASEKYGLAAEKFAKVKQRLPGERDQKEVELIITLSRAWRAMAKAEAESSPGLYEEAANLFDEAKNLSPGDKAKNLVTGHSRLCMALAAGARFADTGDSTLHSAAVRSLESASKYYLKASMEGASEYAKACKLLFDGYVFMNRASSEEDQRTKTKLYSMAEKVLQASASSFEKARQPGRKEQVVKLLRKVKEDRELAVSLVEVFLAPDIVSTTMAFSSPASSHETAVGLDKFEHADVQAVMTAYPKDLHIGQELSLEIELVNAGRGVAQLKRLDQAVPKGFDLVTVPDKCRVEDDYLSMRGRRLDALKTEDVKIVLKPTSKGHFVIKPRIMYLDESGKCRSSEPQPVTVIVKELGLSGWIRGTS